MERVSLIIFAVLPFRKLCVDAQESSNKEFFYTSDPYITSIRKPYEKNVKEFDEDNLHLLKDNELISGPKVA